jgi:hypothetical protein
VNRMKSKAVCMVLLAICPLAHAAATIRGKLVHDKDKSAAAGYRVTVMKDKARTTPARVGPDGMYYIYNVLPGEYQLEIWVPNTAAPVVYKIQVVEPYTDVPQIAVP